MQRLPVGLGRRRECPWLERREHEPVDLVHGPGPRVLGFGHAGLRRGMNAQCGFHSAPARPSAPGSRSRARPGRGGTPAPASSPPGRCSGCAGPARCCPGRPGTMAWWPEGELRRRRRSRCRSAARLAGPVVGTVAREAAVGEDRPDVEVEVDAVGHARHGGRSPAAAGEAATPARAAYPRGADDGLRARTTHGGSSAGLTGEV